MQSKDDVRTLSRFDWEASLVANEARSRVVAWRVASAAVGVSICLAVAVVTLVPLHTVVPYVVSVDKATGETAVVPNVDPVVGTNELSDKHWVSQFVIARERYVYRLLQSDYENVSRFSGPRVWARYSAMYNGPGAIDKKLGDSTEIIPSIISVTLTEAGLATVRLKIDTHAGNGETKSQRYVATLHYDYKLPLRAPESELVANPFGFRVLGYQLDEELTAPGSAP